MRDEVLRVHALGVVELDVVAVDRHETLDALSVELDDRIWITSGRVQLALAHRARAELEDLAVQTPLVAVTHETTRIHVDNDVPHVLGVRLTGLLDDQAGEPGPAGVLLHTHGEVALVAAIDPTRCGVEAPQLIVLPSRHFGIETLVGLEYDDGVDTQTPTRLFQGDEGGRHKTPALRQCPAICLKQIKASLSKSRPQAERSFRR